MNSGDLQARISPYSSKNSVDLTDAKVTSANDKGPNDGSKTSFKDLIMNANSDQKRAKNAQKNGNELSAAKTDAEFATMMANKANQLSSRKPGGNQLDKDAFLKLFITQVQNQDPLKPDDSSAMAAQLAQFDGLEQMMNVNKNLEKMAAENQSSRAVGLINFVGKELKLDGGKLAWRGGKVTDSVYNLERDTSRAMLEVRDAAGVVVSLQDLGQKAAGDHTLEWNGKSKEGKNVPEGVYTFAVLGQDLQGAEVASRITSTVKVTGVDLKDAGGAFYTDVGKVGIGEVGSVGDKGFVSRARVGDAVKDVAGGAGAGIQAGIPVEAIEQAMNAAQQLMQEHGDDPAAVAEAQKLMLAAQQAQQANAELAQQQSQAPPAGPAGAPPVSDTQVPGAPPVRPEPTQAAARPAEQAPSATRADLLAKPTLSASGGIEIPLPKS